MTTDSNATPTLGQDDAEALATAAEDLWIAGETLARAHEMPVTKESALLMVRVIERSLKDVRFILETADEPREAALP